MECELEWLKRVVARHLPDFYLHHDDAYMPCSAEFFMEHSELKGCRHDNGQIITLAPRGSLAGPVLRQLQKDHGSECSHLWMDLDPEARCGAPKEAINDVPVYCHAKSIHSRADPSHIEALELTYITLFAYNGAYQVIPGLIKTGAHDGDIEHITARVDPSTGDLLAMWYNSHRSRDGEWIAAEKVPKSMKTGRHIAYIALNGHGNYPRAGTVMRHFFLGNDKCSETGPVWQPKKVILLPHDADLHVVQIEKSAWKLHCTPSRGCSLNAEITSSITVTTTNNSIDDANEAKSPESCVYLGGEDNNLKYNGVEVISNDPCDWVFFRGDWGETMAMICQSWYQRAETPISRTSLQRICLHVWPETEHI